MIGKENVIGMFSQYTKSRVEEEVDHYIEKRTEKAVKIGTTIVKQLETLDVTEVTVSTRNGQYRRERILRHQEGNGREL